MKNNQNKTELALLILVSIALISSAVFINDNITGFVILSNSNQSDFDQGTYTNTYYNTSINAVMSSTISSTYTSKIFDANTDVLWKNITWTSGGYYQEAFPNYKAIETKLNGINMTGNLLLYHMDESSGNIIDYSGENNNATNSGATYNSHGVFNKGMNFDGNGDAIESSSYTYTFNQEMTLAAWFKYNGGGTGSPRILEISQTGNADSHCLAPDPDGTLRAWAECSTSTRVGAMDDTNNYNDGEWHFMVYTYSNPNAKLYVDGVLTDSVSDACANLDDGNELIIGAISDVSGQYAKSQHEYDGYIDEVAVWNRALDQNEILNMYKRGILRLNLSIRNCSDANCSSTSWQDLTDTSPQQLNLTSRYFQYRFNFESNNTSYSSELYNVSIDYNNPPGDANCSDGIKNQDETDVDCGGICGANCNDGSSCISCLDCLNNYCENNTCVSCNDNTTNLNETDIDCGGNVCNSCDDGKNCTDNSDCSSNSCESNICVSCSDGIINQGEDYTDCGGPCTACDYIPYLYDDCGNPANDSYRIQGTNFTWTSGINPNSTDAEKSISYHNEKVIYNFTNLNSLRDYLVKIKYLQPQDEERQQILKANSNTLHDSMLVPDYDAEQLSYVIPSSIVKDGYITLEFEKTSGPNAVCSEIEIWQSPSDIYNNFTWDFDNENDYSYDSFDIELVNSSAILKTNYIDSEWSNLNQSDFDQGTNNRTYYDNSIKLNLSYNNGSYISQIFDAGYYSDWNTILWNSDIDYQTQTYADTNTLLLCNFNDTTDCIGNMTDKSENGLAYNTGKFNTNGLYLNNTDYLIYNGNNLDPEEGTIQFWFRADNDFWEDGQNNWLFRTRADSANEIHIVNPTSNSLRFRYRSGGISRSITIQDSDSWTTEWHHYVMTWSQANDEFKVYVDGIQKGSTQTNLGNWSGTLSEINIGSSNNELQQAPGIYEELIIYDDVRTQDEIINDYKRASLNLYFDVRSCDDDNCSGESWSSTQNELNISSNKYFQYKANLESPNLDYSPILNNTNIEYTKHVIASSSIIETNDLNVQNLAFWINVSDEMTVSATNLTNYAAQSNGGTIHTYSSSLGGIGANWDVWNLIDGSWTGAAGTDDWASTNPHAPSEYVVIKLNQTVYVHNISVVTWTIGAANSDVKDFVFSVSQDGSNFTEVFNGTAQLRDSINNFELSNPVQARYVKFNFTSNYGATNYMEASELEVYGTKASESAKLQYSTNSGINWTDVPTDKSLSSADTSTDKIRFRANLTGDDSIDSLKVYFRGETIQPSCSDSIKNQDETDIDCGGSICNKCANGKACISDSDCSSNNCDNNICTAQEQNGNGGNGGNRGSSGSKGVYTGISTTQETFTSNIIDSIQPGQEFEVVFDGYIVSVRGISNKTQDRVNFKYQEIKENPAKHSLNNTYKYFEIYSNNLDIDSIEQNIIKFKVKKSWLTINAFTKSEIYMYRLINDEWTELNTSYIYDDNEYAYFEAKTTGFSYFAVIGKKEIIPEIIEKIPEIQEPKQILWINRLYHLIPAIILVSLILVSTIISIIMRKYKYL